MQVWRDCEQLVDLEICAVMRDAVNDYNLNKSIDDLFCSTVSVCRNLRFVQDGLAADVQRTKVDMSCTELLSTKAGTKCKRHYCGLNSKKSCTKSTLLYFAQSMVMIRAVTSSNATQARYLV